MEDKVHICYKCNEKIIENDDIKIYLKINIKDKEGEENKKYLCCKCIQNISENNIMRKKSVYENPTSKHENLICAIIYVSIFVFSIYIYNL